MMKTAFAFGTDSSRQVGSGRIPFPLKLLAILVLTMAAMTVYDTTVYHSETDYDVCRSPLFKCTSCGAVASYSIRELQAKVPPKQLASMKGSLVLDCPKCKKHTLTQAVICLKCENVFAIIMNSGQDSINDKCPKCGESYIKAWQEKYRRETEESWFDKLGFKIQRSLRNIGLSLHNWWIFGFVW
ncbi:MAG: hypothetical protein WC975_02490 [Phycisphaerae bacterium]